MCKSVIQKPSVQIGLVRFALPDLGSGSAEFVSSLMVFSVVQSRKIRAEGLWFYIRRSVMANR